MSISVTVAELKSEPRSAKLTEDLFVSPKVESGNPFAPKPKWAFAKTDGVEAFELHNGRAHLPMSYTFHFYPKLWRSPSRPKISTEFVGELLPRQQEIVEETMSILTSNNTVLLCLHTGFGKTIFSLWVAAQLGHKVLVLCHRKIIMDQWIAAAEKYLPGCTRGVFNPGKAVKSDLPQILVANTINVTKVEHGFFDEYGTLLVDEVHTICTEQFSKSLTRIFPKYLIGLSATPFRSDGMDRLIELYIGPEMVCRKMQRFFHVYKFETGFKPDVRRLPDGSLEWNSVLESQANSRERNMQIVDLVRFFVNRTILVLVKRKDHAVKLQKMLWRYLPKEDVDMFLGTMKKVNYNSRILIGTVSKSGTGFDHPKLDMLIAAADVEENFLQYLGRVFRRDDTCPIYIDLVDDMKVLQTHSSTRLKVCKEAGGVVLKFFDIFKDWKNFLARM
jgi:superfamily II DNA or RNA helicase